MAHYYHNGALYSDPRISAYIGMGLHQMPGNVWWRSWRELPPPAPFADCAAPTRTSPGRASGRWTARGRPSPTRSPASSSRVWEGHYTYPGTNLKFIPTFAGGMFEALMANEVVPETSWGTAQLRPGRRADGRRCRSSTPRSSSDYPVWGMSPSSTADDTGDYAGYGVEGLTFPYYGAGADGGDPNQQLSQCTPARTENTVTPHASFIALDVAPQQAYANIRRCAAVPRRLRRRAASSTRSTRRPARSATGTWCSTSR